MRADRNHFSLSQALYLPQFVRANRVRFQQYLCSVMYKISAKKVAKKGSKKVKKIKNYC